MPLLTKEQIRRCLYDYYQTHYGERDTDVWYEQPATNVWMFARDELLISLQCHIITGDVTVFNERLS